MIVGGLTLLVGMLGIVLLIWADERVWERMWGDLAAQSGRLSPDWVARRLQAHAKSLAFARREAARARAEGSRAAEAEFVAFERSTSAERRALRRVRRLLRARA